jgi:hypothetical protein
VNTNVREAIEAIAAESGIDIRIEGTQLLLAGEKVELPGHDSDDGPVLGGERAGLLGIQGLLPNVPHGDDRDKLLWHVVADSQVELTGSLLDDVTLYHELDDRLNLGPEASRVAAAALKGRFFSNRKAAAMLAVHASLPLNYRHARLTPSGKTTGVGYTMFSGAILPFLLWDSSLGGPNQLLLQQLLDALSSPGELTSLDRRFLEIALSNAPRPEAEPSADVLIAKHGSDLADSFGQAGGPFCEPSLALFERDLRTVLSTPLPRPERAEWLTILISLHVALRMYRIAQALGGDLDRAVAAAGQMPVPDGALGCSCQGRDLAQLQECPLSGRILFRTGSGRFRRVHGTDGCRAAFVELDRRRLLDLLPTLVTRNLSCAAWTALGGGAPAAARDITALSRALDKDPELRRAMDAACAAITVIHHSATRKESATLDELMRASHTRERRPGIHALREDARRMRARDLRRTSQSVVNSLMLKGIVGRGSIIARNGPSYAYFEIDEQILLLLVRLVCRTGQLPFDGFLQQLRAYGLAPQDDAEREALSNTLERLGLLYRYSDAGEASFVHYA